MFYDYHLTRKQLNKISIDDLIEGLEQLKEDYQEKYKTDMYFKRKFSYLENVIEDLNNILDIYNESIDFYIDLESNILSLENKN